MPKKLSTAIVGTLAVGLTLPMNAQMATAAPAVPNPVPTGPGTDVPTTGAGALSGVDIQTTRSASSFTLPLASGSYSYTSPYGPRCIPVQGASTYHLGQDLGASEGTPIQAVADGTVVRTFSGNRYNAGYVVLQHRVDGETYHSAYYHMWDANTHVRTGQTVSAGQTIALVGNSGPSTAPHLHLEIWEGAWLNGASHDPATWLDQRGVNLQTGATQVLNITNPTNCTYYAAADTPLRAAASSSGQITAQLERGAELISSPGDMTNGMVRVQTGGMSGWVAHSDITPTRPSGTGTTPIPAVDEDDDDDAGSSGESGASEAQEVSPTVYRVTTPLNARSGPGTSHPVVQGMPEGEEITVTAVNGEWVQFQRGGQTVWSHGAYLSEVVAAEPSGESGAADSGSSETGSSDSGSSSSPASSADSGDTYRVVDVWLRARSGPGLNHPMIRVLDPDTEITATGRDGDWVSFRSGERTLWVHSYHLEGVSGGSESAGTSSGSSSSGGSSVSSAEGTYRVDGVWLNARTGAGMSSSVYTVMGPGTEMEVTGRDGDWLSFTLDGRTLWAHSGYLAAVSGSSESVDSQTATTTVWQNFRTGPGMSHSVIRGIAPQVSVQLTGERSGVWYQVRIDGQTGWMHGYYLNFSSGGQWLNPEDHDTSDLEEVQEEDVQEEPAEEAPAEEPQDSEQVEEEPEPEPAPEQQVEDEASEEPAPEEEPEAEPAPSPEPAPEGPAEDEAEAPAEEATEELPAVEEETEPAEEAAPVEETEPAEEPEQPESAPEPEPELTEVSAEAPAQEGNLVTVPETEGITYSTGSGQVEVPEGGLTIEASAEEGYELSGQSTWTFEHQAPEPVAVEPPAPSRDGNTVTVPETEGVTYSESGEVEVPAEGITITASAAEGYELSGQEAWSFEYVAPETETETETVEEGQTGETVDEDPSGPSSGLHAQSPNGPYSQVWDRLAQCESDGDWSINTGNGYYGGLQFSQQSWEWVGGSGQPHEASREEQINRAYVLWQRQGWDAWPHCTQSVLPSQGITGLTGNNNDPGGYGDSYFEVHGTGTDTVSTASSAEIWNASYSVPLREEADSSSEKLLQIPRGAELEKLDEDGSWIQVRYTEDGETLTGWVNTDYVAVA